MITITKTKIELNKEEVISELKRLASISKKHQPNVFGFTLKTINIAFKTKLNHFDFLEFCEEIGIEYNSILKCIKIKDIENL